MKHIRTVSGVAAVAALLITAGCASPSQSLEGEPVTLRVAWWGSDARHELTLEVIGLFEDAYPDITIEPEYSGSDTYFDRLSTQIAGGTPPDIMQLSAIDEYGQRGALLDLAPFIGKELEVSDWNEGALESTQLDGAQYGVPLASNGLGLIYNEGLLATVGVDAPSDGMDWGELTSYAGQVADALPESAFALTDRSGYTPLFDYFLRQRDARLYDGSAPAFTAADVIDWLTMWDDWRQDGLIPPSDIAAGYTELNPENSLFPAGGAAMTMQFLNLLPAYESASGDVARVVGLPEGGADASDGNWLHPAQAMAISAKSSHANAAATFLNFFMNDPDAIAVLGTDRGFPTSQRALEFVAEDAPPVISAMLEQFTETSAGAAPRGPMLPSQTAFENEFTLAAQQFAFGQIDATAAADRVIAAAEAAAR